VQTKSTIVKCASHCTEAHKSVTHDLTWVSKAIHVNHFK
jgi:hypothetical protein